MYYEFPGEHRVRIGTNNALGEIPLTLRFYIDPMQIFPSFPMTSYTEESGEG